MAFVDKQDLAQFIGTEAYHRLSIFPMLATDGVRYFCEKAEAFWLFDEMCAFTIDHRTEPFIVAEVVANDSKAVVTYSDGDCRKLATKNFYHSDLEGEYKFYINNGVIMLPSEY